MWVSRAKEPLHEAARSFHSGLTHSEMQPEKQCVTEQDSTHVPGYSPLAVPAIQSTCPWTAIPGTHAQGAARPWPLLLAHSNMVGKGNLSYPLPTPVFVFVATLEDFSQTDYKSGLHCCHCKTYCFTRLCPGPPNKLITDCNDIQLCEISILRLKVELGKCVKAVTYSYSPSAACWLVSVHKTWNLATAYSFTYCLWLFCA